MSRYALTAKANKIAQHVIYNGAPGGIKLAALDTTPRTLALVFGFDFALGHFFQLWEVPDNQADVPLEDIEKNTPLDEEESLIVDQSSMFDRVSHGHILEIFKMLSNDEEKARFHDIMLRCASDLPY